jgi:hypothetical protein
MNQVVDELICTLDSIDNRAELVAFLAPLRAPDDLPNDDRAKLTKALMRAAARCWRTRSD